MQLLVLFALLSILSVSSFMVPGANLGRRMMKSSLDMKATGRVKFFDTIKGFGFITPADGSEDVFVHQTSILAQGFRSLAEGEDVEYDVAIDESKGGKKFATNVTGPNGAYVQGAKREFNDGGRGMGMGGMGMGGMGMGGMGMGGMGGRGDRY